MNARFSSEPRPLLAVAVGLVVFMPWTALAQIEVRPSFDGARRERRARAEDLTREAIGLASNETEQKIALYSQAIDADPTFYPALANRAVCYLNYALWSNAIDDATRAIALDSQESFAWAVRGRAYAGKRLYAKAFEDLSRALERTRDDENRKQLYNDRGNSNYSARLYRKAIEDYRAAVRIDPEFAKAWNNLGIAFRAMGNYDDALEHFDRAARIDEKAARVFVNRGQLYVARNDRTLAEEDFNRAIELDPADPAALIHRGMFRYLVDQFADAQEDFDAAYERYPENPHVAIWRYLTAARQSNKDKPKEILSSYLQARKEKDDMWPIPIVNLFLDNRKIEQVLTAALANDDEDPQSGSDEEAYTTDREARKRERSAEAHFYIAEFHRLNNREPERMKHLKLAVENKVPRQQEWVMAGIMIDGWKTPLAPAPREVNPSKKPGTTQTEPAEDKSDAPASKQSTPKKPELLDSTP